MTYSEKDKKISTNGVIRMCTDSIIRTHETTLSRALNTFFRFTVDQQNERVAEIDKILAWMKQVLIHTKAFTAGLDVALDIVEQRIFERIYKTALQYNGEIDVQRDECFSIHVNDLEKVLSIDHPAIAINPR